MRGGKDGKMCLFVVIFGSKDKLYGKVIEVAASLALGTTHISLGISALL